MKTPRDWQFELSKVWYPRTDGKPCGDVPIQDVIKAIQADAKAEGLADKERLDWLDKNRTAHIYEHFKYNSSNAATQKTWRDAIDVARASRGGGE